MNTLKPAFNLLEAGYNEIINIRNAYSPNTVLLFHGYDYAISDGRGVCGKGPWLQPGLEERNIPMKLHRDVVRLFLEEFAKLLHRISKRNDRIIFVPTQGTLVDSEWANELHPINSGFKKVAIKFSEFIGK